MRSVRRVETFTNHKPLLTRRGRALDDVSLLMNAG
jgi:hypothetical protein